MNKIILRNETLRLRAIELLERQELDPVVLEMIIRPHKSKRTDAQNRRFHKLISMAVEYSNGDLNLKEDIESFKLEMKVKFLDPIKEIPLPDGTVYVVYPSTAKMPVDKMNHFMTQVEDFIAITFNITLPAIGWENAY